MAQRHTAVVPRHLLERVVRRTVGGDLSAEPHPITIGHVNEVYAVRTNLDREAIVRISREEHPGFEVEAWAMRAARELGAPTARVYGIEREQHEAENLTFSVQEKLPGINLYKMPAGSRDAAKLGPSLGAAIGAIHAVQTGTAGWLSPDGSVTEATLGARLRDLPDRSDDVHEAAAHWHVDADLVDEALELLATHAKTELRTRPRLVHNDFKPSNVLVMDGRVSGLVDLQGAFSGDPVIDFAYWHSSCTPDLGLDALRPGYGDSSVFDGNFELILQVALVHQSLTMLRVRRDMRNRHGVENTIRDLVGAVSDLRSHSASSVRPVDSEARIHSAPAAHLRRQGPTTDVGQSPSRFS